LSENPKILLICETEELSEQMTAHLDEQFQIEKAESLPRAMALLRHNSFEGVFVSHENLSESINTALLLQNEEILEGMPDGIVLLDSENKILWANNRIQKWSHVERIEGENFYSALGNPEILGPDFCPFHTSLATGNSSSTTLRTKDHLFYHLHVAPIKDKDSGERYKSNLIVTIRDITQEMMQKQKLAAIHQAGMDLADLTPDELFQMSVGERIELLKSNILHFTKDLLNFDMVEIRILDPKSNQLETLLALGMEPEAADRVLFAQPQNNGVTGFVAATGKSYLCEDTSEDPLYLQGASNAKSSLTVPLVLHDEVIGTFNVESPETRAFTESDLQFLEIFTRDVAAALNTLELLVAEKASTAAESVEAIHSAVAVPVDEILNQSVNLMERYIGHEPEVVGRLQEILRHARNIKQVIQSVGKEMSPVQAHPQSTQQTNESTRLRGRRVLLVDEDSAVRSSAHAILERYGCVVETAPNGAQAIFMARNLVDEESYDVVLADIRLPDVSGYDFLTQLREIMQVEPLPLILMTGFGYDPGHSIVKARQAGVKSVLYKPFRLDQLLTTVEEIATQKRSPAKSSSNETPDQE
jgi:CheY-like chemotaxis protein